MIDNRPPPIAPCVGLCRGDRGALDSPAYVSRDGTGLKVVVCSCCRLALRPATPAEQPVHPANLRPELTAEHVLYKDDVCIYDTVLLKDIRAT